MNVFNRLKENVVVAVIRKARPDNIIPIVEALLRGGVKSIEITAERCREQGYGWPKQGVTSESRPICAI